MLCLGHSAIFLYLLTICALVRQGEAASSSSSSTSPSQRPSLYLFGDSTMATCRYSYLSKGTSGWGTSLAAYLNLDAINVVNLARSGYSSRQAARENIYAKALEEAKTGDYLILQWGRNDGSLSGASGDKVVCEKATKCTGVSSAEPFVYSFEEYLTDVARKFRAKGVQVIIASLATQNPYLNGQFQISRKDDEFISGAQKAAQNVAGTTYIDMHSEMISLFRHSDGNQVDQYYFGGSQAANLQHHNDITHFTPLGSLVAAKRFLAGLQQTTSSLKKYVRQSPGVLQQPKCPG